MSSQPLPSSLRHPRQGANVAAVLQNAIADKRRAEGQVDWEALRHRAHDLKAYTMDHLDRLLVQFEASLQARGGTVLWAATREEALAHVTDICRRHDVTSVVKGKSMLSEELELNAHLERAGIAAVETDLGEYIVQLAGQGPSHVTAPALHLSRQQIGEIFAQRLGIPYSDDPHVLMEAARTRLRERYLTAGAGITGVNFAAADTGTLVVVENEGNGGLSASVPPVHIALMGMEKLIPRLRDLPVFLALLARAATGQKLTSYTHHFLGPFPGRYLYCVVVDAGRSAMLADPHLREALFCIRCGACLNVCPVYRRAGGLAYESTYAGPIGAVISPQLRGGASAAQLPYASSLCGACKQECPVMIDLPHQLVYLRSKAVRENTAAHGDERWMLRAFTWCMRRPWAYRLASAVVRALLPLGVPGLQRWTRRRRLPAPPAQSFKQWWQRR